MRNYTPLPLLCSCLVSLLLSFQVINKDLDRAFKAIQEKDFMTAERLFNKILADQPHDAGSYFGLASVYAHPDFMHRSPQRALEYLAAAERNLAALREKEMAYLQQFGCTQSGIAQLREQLGKEIVLNAYTHKSITGLEEAMSQFVSMPELVLLARKYRDELAFAETEKENTYQAFQGFLVKYPDAAQAPEARKKYDSLLYQGFVQIGTPAAYEQFLKSYPNSPYYQEVKAEYDRVIYEKTAQHNTPQAYQAFIRNNPNSLFLEKARLQLARFTMRLPVRIGVHWGFINGWGELVISPVYEKAGLFADGLARIRQKGKWGYIDDHGKPAIEAVFDGARDFSEGLAIVMQKKRSSTDHQTFFIDTTGKPAFDEVFETKGAYMPIHPFSGGYAAVLDAETNKLGFINTKGDFIIAPMFTPVVYHENTTFDYPFSGFSNGYAWVKEATQEGLINAKGLFLVQGNYTQPHTDTIPHVPAYRHSFSDGLCLVQQKADGLAYYIDTKGKKVFSLPAGTVGFPFSDGVAWLKFPTAQRYQLVDKTGQVLADLTAVRVGTFHEGLAVVQKESPVKRVYFYDEVPEGSYLYLDKQGKQVFDFKFHVLRDPAHPYLDGAFRLGVAGILLEGKQTYIDRAGTIIWQSKESW